MSWTSGVSASVNVSTLSPPQQDCDPFLDSTLVKVIKTIAYSVLLILSLGGNSLVIAVIYRNRNLRTIINFFILNMAIVDVILPVFAHTKRMKQIYLPRGLWPTDGIIGSPTCKFTFFAEDLSIVASVLTLEMIAVERFFSVVFPMKRQLIRNKRSCLILVALIWLSGAVYPSSHFYSKKIIHKGTTPYCIYSWEPAFDHAEAVKIEFTIIVVAFTMIPFLLLTGLYSAIIISLHQQEINLNLASNEVQRRARENKRIMYMLVTVVISFLVIWLPINIYFFLSAFVWSSHRPCESRHLIFSAMLLSYSYPAINPFIYYFFNENYRKGFHELFCCCRSYGFSFKNQKASSCIYGNITYDVSSVSSKKVVLLSLRSLEI